TVANNGQQALDALEKGSFDAVLMDVQMPAMDGFEATGIIRKRENESGGHIPIIAMTAHAMEGDRERCLEAGMDAYIAKPIRAADLHDTVEATVARMRSSHRKDSRGENGLLDRTGILEQTGASPEALKEIVELFAVESERLMKRMKDAIKNADASGLQRAAHTLKGSVRIFGAERVASAALRLEKIGGDKNLVDAEDALAELARELEQLLPMLTKLVKS
ncbi:MAG: response regulator, partial [Phycisphaerales bacterium]